MSSPEDHNTSGAPAHEGESNLHEIASDSFDTNKNGFHQHYFPSGDFYKGNWKDNKMHGEGTLILNVDKSVVSSTVLVSFQGEFDNGLPVNGRAEYADGSIFDGDLVDGLQHGHGVYTKNGLSVNGTFSNGSPVGQVNVIFQDGDDLTSYTGELHFNCLHGKNALIRFPSASIISSYQGEFNFNARVGWGVLTFRPPQNTTLSINTTGSDNGLDSPRSTTITTTLSSSRFNKNTRTVAPTRESQLYRYDGFTCLPGSNIYLSPHYHIHASTATAGPSSSSNMIRKVFGLFDIDRLVFGTIYYADGSIYTGFLLSHGASGQHDSYESSSSHHYNHNSSSITTTLDTNYPPSTHRPADINPFYSHEAAIFRHGFGVMYHHCGNNSGTVTLGEWAYDHPHGQTITLYNFHTPSTRYNELWQTEIEKQQDYEELEPKDEANRSTHFIFSRDLIMQGEVAVLKHLRELIEANNTQQDGQTESSPSTTPNSNLFSFSALYVGHLQRGIRQDQGLYLTIQRYTEKHASNNSCFNFPPLLPNNEVDAYFGTWADDLPHNSGQYVFLQQNPQTSNNPNSTTGLTSLLIAWEYLLHYKFHYQFDVIEFQKYKHQLLKDASKTNPTSQPSSNNACSLSYYSGSSFYSSRTFGLSLFTTATHDSTRPDVLFYGLHHAPTNDSFNRAKTRSYCQNMVTFLHSDLYRNYNAYKQYYLNNTNSQSNLPTTTIISQQVINQPEQLIEHYQNTPADGAENAENAENAEELAISTPQQPTSNSTTITTTVNVTVLPDKYMQPSSFNAITANNVRGDSNLSTSLSMPNIGALFYFSPNQFISDVLTTSDDVVQKSTGDVEILTKTGPYKSVSIWFGAVTLSLQRLGHGCLCLDIDMDQFIKNNSVSYQKKTNLYGGALKTSQVQHAAFSALRTNNSNNQSGANQADSWIINSNYTDPLSHPLLLFFLSDNPGHFTSMTQLQTSGNLFTAASTTNNANMIGSGAKTASHANSPQHTHSNSQFQQHQLVNLFSNETITSVSALKVFSFFLYDVCFFGTIVGKSSIWQGPIATLLLPSAPQLSALLEQTTAPNGAMIHLSAFKQLLDYIAAAASRYTRSTKNKNYTDLLGDQQHNKLTDEKFARHVQRFHSTPFLTTDLTLIEQFLCSQQQSLITKDDDDSLKFEALRSDMLKSVFAMLLDSTKSSSQPRQISPCCPQLGQFYAYGLGEMHYLMKQHLDGTAFSSQSEKYTGFVLLAPLTLQPDAPVDKYGCNLQNGANHPLVNKYLSRSHTVFSKLTTIQAESSANAIKLDPFQQDALTTLQHYDGIIHTLAKTNQYLSKQQHFPTFDPASPTPFQQSNDPNAVFSIINVLLDGAITTANSPNVFLGNLVDTTPLISVISPQSVHHSTSPLRLLPLSHGIGTITAGNFSQCQTVGHFDLGVILEGVETDDTGDVYIGPYITVINEHTGEKQQQRHGKYIVVLLLRKWVTICHYDHGQVTTGQVYYNVQQHILNELTELKPSQVESFDFDQFSLNLYNNRAALQHKLLSNAGRGQLYDSLQQSQAENPVNPTAQDIALGEDIFALNYDPAVTDITEVHGYSRYFVTTNDDLDKASEPLYEDEIVEILHSITIPPSLNDDPENEKAIEEAEANGHKTDVGNLIVRVTGEGLVCFDRADDGHIGDDTKKAENESVHRTLTDQVRTQRAFRYRLPAPDVIGQLSRLYYVGGLDSGFLPHGVGELTWSTPNTRAQFTPQQHFSISLSPETAPCEKYTGSFEHGVLHGEGVVSYHTPDDYSLVDYNTATHVSSSFLCPCVKEFQGEFSVGCPVAGKIIFDPNSFIAGQTYKLYKGNIGMSGEFEGDGLLTYADGHKFKGKFKHNLPTEGTLVFTNGVKYHGLMHSVASQDIMLDPFYLDIIQKITALQQQSGHKNHHNRHHGGQPFMPVGLQDNTMAVMSRGKTPSNEQLAYGNVFTFSHFTVFQQLCQFLSSHYQSFAYEHQYRQSFDEEGNYIEPTDVQLHSSQYYDVPIPLNLSLFSPLFLDMKQQKANFEAQQLQEQSASAQQHSCVNASPSKDRPGSSSSSSEVEHENEQSTSIFDMRQRLQQLMLKLKAYNQQREEFDTANPKSKIIPFTNSHVTPAPLDLKEKAIEAEIINFMHDLKTLTAELYPHPQQRSTTQTSLIPIEQQPPYESMYILYQGKLTVISLKQIVRLFGIGSVIFPDETIYDDVNPSHASFLYRCKEIVQKTVGICLDNTKQTVQELTLEEQDDMKAWPLLPLPSSSAIKNQLDLQQQQISRHTQSLTLGIHENINLSAFGTDLQNKQFAVSSTNYKSRLNETLVNSLKELQQIVQSERSQRGSTDTTITDSLNEFLDEEASEKEEDFDPTKEKVVKSPQVKKPLTHSRTSPVIESPRQLGQVPTLNVPKVQNKNETVLGGVLKFILPASLHKQLLNTDGEEDGSALAVDPTRLQDQDIEYIPQCDSEEYIDFKIQQVSSQKALISSKLNKLKAMLDQEEEDYASCCQRFGKEQFSQTDALAITAPIWSTHQATGLLFEKQCESLKFIEEKHKMLVSNPMFSHSIYTVLDTNIDVLELSLLRKEIVQEDRLRILFLLTKITMAFKHRRLLLVLLLHSLSRRDSIISIVNSGITSHNDGILKQFLAPTRVIFQQINDLNALIISLKDKLRANLSTMMNETIPAVQKKNRLFLEQCLNVTTTEFTALRSRINSTWSEFNSALTTLTQTIASTTILLEKRRKQRSELSQVLFVEELQHHIYKNDLLSTYALIYATNYAPEVIAMLRSRSSKDHPLDLTTYGQRTWLTAIQLSCVLGLPHMTVLLHRLGCSLAQRTATSINFKKGDTSSATTQELTIPDHLSNKHIIELIVDSNHIDMLGVLHYLGFPFETTNISTTTISYDKEQNKRVQTTIRPLLHHYVKKHDMAVVKYLLLLGMDPNIYDNSHDNITSLMLACASFSTLCLQHAKHHQDRSPSAATTRPQVKDKFAQSAYEDTVAFGVSTATPEEEFSKHLQTNLDNAVEIVHLLVQYGAKLTCKDQSQNTCLHHLFSAFYDQQPQPGSQQLFPPQLKQLSSWLVSHGARYRELRNDKNQPAYYHSSLCADFDAQRNAYIAQSQQFSYNFIALTSKDQRWQLDEDCHHCTDCEVEFGMFTRKHHCRCCGYIYCEPCSKITINNNTIRCCGSCYNKMHMVTTPRDRRRDIQQAQQRGDTKQTLPDDPISPSSPNFATFLPQFIQDFHEELYLKFPQRFAPRGTCRFLPTVVKSAVGDYMPQLNLSFKSISTIITKNTQLSKDLHQLDQIKHTPQSARPTSSTAGPIAANQSGQTLMGNSRVQPGVPKVAAPPVPKSGVPPPKGSVASKAPPKLGAGQTQPQTQPPPTSQPHPLPPSEPIGPQSANTVVAPVEAAKKEEKLTRRTPAHLGQITDWPFSEEEDAICRKVKALLEQTGSVGSVANQGKPASQTLDESKFVLIHVSEDPLEDGASKAKKKPRNPLEDDLEDDPAVNKVLNLATQVQQTPLDQPSTDPDFDLFG